MGASRNQESTRQEKDGVVYYDRGILTGKDGRRYQRYAIHTHFVQPGEDQAELVRRYVLPLYQPGDCLSFTAKVMGMCTNNVRTLEDTHPGFWAKTLAPFAGHNSTGIGMHQPYKMQLVIEICGLPRVLFAAAVSAITRPFGIRGLFYKICGHGVAGKVHLHHRGAVNGPGDGLADLRGAAQAALGVKAQIEKIGGGIVPGLIAAGIAQGVGAHQVHVHQTHVPRGEGGHQVL